MVAQRRHPVPAAVRSHTEPSVCHPIAIAHDPYNTHLMVTHRAAGITTISRHILCLQCAHRSPLVSHYGKKVRGPGVQQHLGFGASPFWRQCCD
jgi:hypothetical protein